MSLQFIKPESIPFNIKIITEKDIEEGNLNALPESSSFEVEHLKKVVDWQKEEKIHDLEPIEVTKKKA